MNITGDWITAPATQRVLAVLAEAGHRALLVGGCVRNALLDVPVSDIDIATDARPEAVMKYAEAAGLKPVPTGLEHGTVTVIVDHVPHEVTTFRTDVETHGRHATIAFSDDLTEDARRRDFTMNALYAEADGSVVDPLGGLPDLMARRVRFIDDAGQRIREDYLRILRFFRFHAWYGNPQQGLDADGLAAVATHLDGLADLSRERVGAEIIKLLSAPDPAPSVAAMRSTGVLARVLPGADDRCLAPLIHLETGLGVGPQPLRRLACLGGEDVPDLLRLSKSQARQLELLRTDAVMGMGAGELGYRFGAETGLDVLLLRAALMGLEVDAAVQAQLAQGAAADFPIRAADLMPDLSGPALGDRLKALEQRWIDSEFRLSRAELLQS